MTSPSEPVSKDLGRCLVTGAAGFVGKHLVRALLREGCPVRALIRKTPLSLADPSLEIVRGEIEDRARMLEVCEGVDCVFHVAANVALLGGRAAPESYRRAAYATNVEGTKNVVAACRERGVRRLVHTSTIDVCFKTEDDLQMDSRTPYAANPLSLYTETKILAERAVLAANGEGGLLTTALRSDGVYGPASNAMLDELVDQVVTGKFVATMGGRGGVHDHIYIDNLVHAQLLAAKHLVPGSPVCGRAYFVGDGHRVPMFEFFRPMVEGLGYAMPKRNVPAQPVMLAMRAWQYLHFKLGLPRPLFSPHELAKLTVSHCGTNEDATRDFGYGPVVSPEEAMNTCAAYYKRKLLSEHPVL